MFKHACEVASGFTIPVVVMERLVSGECRSAVGAGVVVNKDGWLLTANHILQSIAKLDADCNKTNKLLAERVRISSDNNLNDKEKRRKLNYINIDPKSPTAFAVCYGFFNSVKIVNWIGVEAVDLALGKMEGFDPNSVPNYPKFINPLLASASGTSLCKLGFPFHSIIPSWDPLSNGFQFPQGALPMPRFPLEGMYTREVLINVAGHETGTQPPFPLKMIETSSPGLKGQSGGPTFDVNGAVWAIQALTAHLELGFSPRVKGAGIEHQFLNVGMGAHVETIIGLLDQAGVSYELAAI